MLLSAGLLTNPSVQCTNETPTGKEVLKLHHAPNSRSGRIVWLLKELDLSYELNAMAFHPKDLKSDEHRARHPLGRVPVLEDGDVRIYESGAIVEYIMAQLTKRGKGNE